MKIKFLHIATLALGLLSSESSQAQQEVDSILEVARLRFFNEPERAIAITDSLQATNTLDPNYTVKTLLVKATAHMSLRDYPVALSTALKTETLLPEVDIEQQLNSLNKIGELYYNLKLYDKALTYLDRSLNLLESQPPTAISSDLLGFNYATRGFIYREQMSCDIAITYFDRALKQYQNLDEAIGNANSSIILSHKGNCLKDQGRYEEATEVYQESIRYAEKLQAKTLVSYPKLGMAEILILTDRLKEAQTMLLETLQQSESVGDLELNRDLYRSLADTYLAENDRKNYIKYHHAYLEALQEIDIIERQTVNAYLGELKLEQQGKAEKIQEDFHWKKVGLLLLTILVLVVGAFLVLKYKRQLRDLMENFSLNE